MSENENVIDEMNKQLAELGIESEPLDASAKDSESEEETEQESTEEKPRVDEETHEEEPVQHLRENAFKKRENKRREEVDGLKSEISELKDLVKQVLSAKSVESKEEAVDELTTYANENNLDANSLGKLADIIEKRALSKLPTRESKPDPMAQEAVVFNQEWDAFSDNLLQQFPNATASQLKAARIEMDKLSHSKEFHEFPLDYVFFKNQEQFKDLLYSPRKKTGESGKIGAASREEEPYDFDGEITNPKQALAESARLYELLGDDEMTVRRNGERV